MDNVSRMIFRSFPGLIAVHDSDEFAVPTVVKPLFVDKAIERKRRGVRSIPINSRSIPPERR